MQDVTLRSGKMDWGTPLDLFKKLNDVYQFDLDVAASDEVHLCDRYMTPDRSALEAELWGKAAFCNPPCGRMLPKFLAKADEVTQREGGTHRVVVLCPARVGSRSFQDLVFGAASAILFVGGRIMFVGADNPAPFDSCIVEYCGPGFEPLLKDVQLQGQYFELPDRNWWQF